MTSPNWMTVAALAITMLILGILLGFQLAYRLPGSSTGSHNHTATLPVADAIAQATEPPASCPIADRHETISPATYFIDECQEDDTGEIFRPELEAQWIAEAYHAAWSRPVPEAETLRGRRELIQRTLAGLRGLSNEPPTEPFPLVRRYCTTSAPGQQPGNHW